MKKNKLEILEALRGLAALYVVFHHMTLDQKKIWAYPFIEGQAAVILFFVLSGFVIYYSSEKAKQNRQLKFKDYFIKRFRRIYPIFLVSLIVAYCATSISNKTLMPFDGHNLTGNLFNLQDIKRIPGMWFKPYYGNNPLWSLSYEWWFYLLFFPVFKYAAANVQKYYALGISVVGFITFLLYNNKISITLEYFFIWWSGVELCRAWLAKGTIDFKSYLNIFAGYTVMIILCGLQVFFHKGRLNVDNHPVIELRHYGYGIIIITIGILWRMKNFIGYKYILRPFLIFSSMSYGIYVFHATLTYRNDNLFGFSNVGLNYLFGFISTLILAYIFEVPVQNWINKITDKIFKLNKSRNPIIEEINETSKLLPG